MFQICLKHWRIPGDTIPTDPIFTARKQSLGQGNIFSSVCQEFCSQGGQYVPPGRYNPLAGTPPRQVHPPWAGTPPDRYTPSGRYTPLGRYTPWEQCMLGDTGNKRAVRILLECNAIRIKVQCQETAICHGR